MNGTETEESRRPVILAVDDDPQVLRAVRRDLRSVYADRYRVLGAASAAEALNVLDTLEERGHDPALFLVDQRMPDMTGVEFLLEAVSRFPDARRVLLTAYAETDAAITAINKVRLDYYLMKPWDPPAERLFPVLDDLLSDWLAAYRPAYRGIRVVGHLVLGRDARGARLPHPQRATVPVPERRDRPRGPATAHAAHRGTATAGRLP